MITLQLLQQIIVFFLMMATVGNNDCTAGAAVRPGTGLCQYYQCNDNSGQHCDHAFDGDVLSGLKKSAENVSKYSGIIVKV